MICFHGYKILLFVFLDKSFKFVQTAGNIFNVHPFSNFFEKIKQGLAFIICCFSPAIFIDPLNRQKYECREHKNEIFIFNCIKSMYPVCMKNSLPAPFAVITVLHELGYQQGCVIISFLPMLSEFTRAVQKSRNTRTAKCSHQGD